jgi:hypothetical protein
MRLPLLLQALPTTLKKHEDVLFLDVARSQRWRQCAKCGHMIELREGCRHMKGKCGFEFCFTCGKPWERAPSGRGPSQQACEWLHNTNGGPSVRAGQC